MHTHTHIYIYDPSGDPSPDFLLHERAQALWERQHRRERAQLRDTGQHVGRQRRGAARGTGELGDSLADGARELVLLHAERGGRRLGRRRGGGPQDAVLKGGARGEKTYIEYCIDYQKANAPLTRDREAEDVGATAAFLCSPLAAGITGVNLYVDNGVRVMAASVDSESFKGFKFSYPFPMPGEPEPA